MIKQKLLPSTPWLESLTLDNLKEQIPLIQQEIEKTRDQLDFPIHIQSLEKLKSSCTNILEGYGHLRFKLLQSQTQNEKTKLIQGLILEISSANSKEEILYALNTFKSTNNIGPEHMNQLSTIIHNSQNLLERISMLSKANFPELKQWVMESVP